MNKIVSVHYNSYVEAFNCIDKEKSNSWLNLENSEVSKKYIITYLNYKQ